MTNRQHIFLYLKPFSLYNPKLSTFHIQQISLTQENVIVDESSTRNAGYNA